METVSAQEVAFRTTRMETLSAPGKEIWVFGGGIDGWGRGMRGIKGGDELHDMNNIEGTPSTSV
jgi:hypothetical protein